MNKKHTAADGLSRRKATLDEMKKKAKEGDIDNFIDAQLDSFWASPLPHASVSLESEQSLGLNFLVSCLQFSVQHIIGHFNLSYFPFFSSQFIYLTSILPVTTRSKSKKKRKKTSSSNVPKRNDLALTSRGVDKSMESDEYCSSHNKQMNEQELLFVDDDLAPNNSCTWLFISQLTITPDNDNLILEPSYSKSSQCITFYLTTFQKSTGLTAKEF